MSWRTGRSRFGGDPRRTGMRRARLTDRGVTGGGAGGRLRSTGELAKELEIGIYGVR